MVATPGATAASTPHARPESQTADRPPSPSVAWVAPPLERALLLPPLPRRYPSAARINVVAIANSPTPAAISWPNLAAITALAGAPTAMPRKAASNRSTSANASRKPSEINSVSRPILQQHHDRVQHALCHQDLQLFLDLGAAFPVLPPVGQRFRAGGDPGRQSGQRRGMKAGLQLTEQIESLQRARHHLTIGRQCLNFLFQLPFRPRADERGDLRLQQIGIRGCRGDRVQRGRQLPDIGYPPTVEQVADTRRLRIERVGQTAATRLTVRKFAGSNVAASLPDAASPPASCPPAYSHTDPEPR